ncbi:hypothetical protein EUGRSUZ_K00744 [Eucalyptus grandis]|uniref:Uncharacterized protein n=2 Tax=Eucalyptus grandis TaxID=71139 RepID=A0ACC3IRH2_EUCGR|nr:hypothetical protein EUGRSUZ_K00744 [Eucalyptus grandis]
MVTDHILSMAYLDAATENVKQLAQDFVTEMDHDRNGVVCLSEFLSFTKVKGYELNACGTGKLSFDEAITVFYIATSARPLCDGCRCLTPGMFFTCVKCFKDTGEAETFNLCSDCFSHGNHTHPHHKQTKKNLVFFLFLNSSLNRRRI